VTENRTLKILEESLLSGLADTVDIKSTDPEEVAAKFKELFEGVADECQESSLIEYRSMAPKLLKQSRKSLRGFEKRNFKRWKAAFDHLEMIWAIAQELGEVNGREIKADGDKDDNAVMAALAHLFPNALLISQEIICLLKGGFADGALARWRSLHEVSVTAMYVIKHGEKAAIAYLMSFHFAARRSANQVNDHAARAGLQTFSKVELLQFDLRCAEAEKLLGRKIDKDKNGEWPAITQIHKNFAEIEKQVGMDHWRPRYKWASSHTHANHRPTGTLLGMSEATDNAHLIGQSNSGLVDPFQMTAITLAQITATYLLYTPNPDRIVHSKVILRLSEEMTEIAMDSEQISREKFEEQKSNKPVS